MNISNNLPQDEKKLALSKLLSAEDRWENQLSPPSMSLDSTPMTGARRKTISFGIYDDELERLNQLINQNQKSRGGPAIPDHEGFYENLSKRKFQDKAKNMEVATWAIKNLKYHKKIDGPTLFSDEKDSEKPGWVFIHDSLFSPIYDEKYKRVINSFKAQGEKIQKKKKNERKGLQSIRSKMSSMNICLGMKSSKTTVSKISPTKSNSKSPDKNKERGGSVTKIEIIDEVRESKEGLPKDESDAGQSPRITSAEKANSPFKLRPNRVDSRRSKTPQAHKPKKNSGEVPAYIKKSPRWKKIELLNKDLDNVSLNFLQYTDYLVKVKRDIEREKYYIEQEIESEIIAADKKSSSPSRQQTRSFHISQNGDKKKQQIENCLPAVSICSPPSELDNKIINPIQTVKATARGTINFPMDTPSPLNPWIQQGKRVKIRLQKIDNRLAQIKTIQGLEEEMIQNLKKGENLSPRAISTLEHSKRCLTSLQTDTSRLRGDSRDSDLNNISLKFKRHSIITGKTISLMDDIKNQRKIFTRQKDTAQTIYTQARLMTTEAGTARIRIKKAPMTPLSMDTSAGMGFTTKRNSTQATQRKKIGIQLNTFLAAQGDNFINYKQFAKLLVSENKQDQYILRRMAASKQQQKENEADNIIQGNITQGASSINNVSRPSTVQTFAARNFSIHRPETRDANLSIGMDSHNINIRAANPEGTLQSVFEEIPAQNNDVSIFDAIKNYTVGASSEESNARVKTSHFKQRGEKMTYVNDYESQGVKEQSVPHESVPQTITTEDPMRAGEFEENYLKILDYQGGRNHIDLQSSGDKFCQTLAARNSKVIEMAMDKDLEQPRMKSLQLGGMSNEEFMVNHASGELTPEEMKKKQLSPFRRSKVSPQITSFIQASGGQAESSQLFGQVILVTQKTSGELDYAENSRKKKKKMRQRSGDIPDFLPIGSVGDPKLLTSQGFKEQVSELSIKYNLKPLQLSHLSKINQTLIDSERKPSHREQCDDLDSYITELERSRKSYSRSPRKSHNSGSVNRN